ncbi:Replication initiator protein A (plasmid) [Rubrobacter radiotolerans]|uniref:Replication initiator protein A n=1 Tax=Rubrobacter radiotolerans TaxID=42256 RepID=A0A023X7T1_RUBRA|nr:replication initiator protein A [Rubrobacter radiotolerans]AHY48398.1 Replication initiator protein A [Rubrobacter radiotolerans]MDX5895627.1 replication initiator protein A [Rubrobacter radiotolerans]SMC01408.1 Plasmid replication initiator protein [Rubrobacter radiotolerans DSM 5868]
MSDSRAEETLVRAESNLEEYPLFAVKSRNRRENHLVFERRRLGEDGTELVQRWEVEPPAKLGMPGPFDQDVYLAVLQLLEVRGGMPKNGELDFSLYELRDILGWSSSGNTYEKIRQSLRRISSTTLTSENAFYSKIEERFLSDTFQIWTVHFARTRRGKSFRERHTLRFHPIFIRNYIAQYLKGLDPTFYWGLASSLSKRLYRLIDHQRNGGLVWETDLRSLKQQVPLSNYSYPSEIRRALKGAHGELIARKFLSRVEYSEEGGVYYHVSQDFARRQKARELSGNPRELFAIERLMAEGLRGDVARDLVARSGSEKCLRYADSLDSQRGIRNRAGWLKKAIEEEFELADTLPMMLFESDGAPRSPAPPSDGIPEPVEPDPAAREAWDGLLEALYASSDPDSNLPTWFEGFVPVSLDDAVLRVLAPNTVAADYVRDRFGDDLTRTWRSTAGPDAVLEIKSMQSL